jgi:putative membrane protein
MRLFMVEREEAAAARRASRWIMERRAFLLGLTGVIVSSPAFARSRIISDFRSQDLMTGGFALESSNIALQKSGSGDIASFARAEIAEQVQVANMLGAAPGTAPLARRDAAMLAQLQSLPSGRSFERMYVTGQIEGHRKLLALNTAHVRPGGQYSDVANMSLPIIQRHLATLMSIREIA